MSGVWTTGRIRQEINRLADWRSRLTAALSLGASQLATQGLVPEDELLADLTDYRQRMRSLATQMAGRPPAADVRLSLELLEENFQKSQQREELVRELGEIAGLSHTDDPTYAPLERCREDARRCQQRLMAPLDPGDDEQVRLLAREHELQAVLALSDQAAVLADDDWNRLQDVVSVVYGRNLAAALARGRIRRSGSTPPFASTAISAPATLVAEKPIPLPEPPVAIEDLPSIHALAGSHIRQAVELTPPVSEETVVASPHDAMATDPDTSTRWFSSGSSVLPGVSTAEATTAESDPAASQDITLDSPPPVIDLDLPKPVWHNDPAARLAREIAAESPRTALRLNALVLQLVRDDRVALAAHLARSGERFSSGRGIVPPAGLLRALLLGRSLSYAHGELARDVELELKPFVNATPTIATGDDERLGLSLIQRAAALLPALLGASPSASALLRSFAIEPGLSHLYNYCSRVAAFGERLQSQAVELFQAPAEQTQWQAERKQLQSEVRDWLAQSVKRGVMYQRSSPLFLHAHWTVLASPTQRHPHEVMAWAKWQEVFLLVHRMLRPIWDGTAERNDVRVELTRATGMVSAESPDHAVMKTGAGRGLMPLTEPMRNVLLEAIDLANRWLRLQSSAPTRGLHLAPQQAEELRTELLERTSGVVAELDVVARTRSSDIVQTGICACRRTIEQIRRLCGGEVPLALHEPDARHLLYSEFLKMPHTELGENWQPMGEPAEQEQAILEHLSSSWSDWLSAFALQCHQEDHLATSRVLDLPVWTDQATLAELHRLRGQELHRTRQSVMRDLDELASQVALDVDGRPDLEPGCTELNLRLERIRAAIPQILSFAPLRSRLDRYREQWQRLVTGDPSRPELASLPLKEDSGILPALTAAVNAATETADTLPESSEQWVFLEE